MLSFRLMSAAGGVTPPTLRRPSLGSGLTLVLLLVFCPVPGLAAEAGDRGVEVTGGSVGSSKAVPVIMPWLEVNALGQQRIDWAVEGLRVWRKVTDTAIVSTKPGCAALYTRLRQRVPGMRIIPGMKTSSLLPRFDSVEGWKAVAREVREVCATSGENRVVMENEGALNSYWRKEYEIDPDRLREGLRQLPDDVGYIWYPGFVGEDAETKRRAEQVCRIVDEVLAARITDTSISSPAGFRRMRNKGARQRHAAIAKSVKRPRVPMLYCCGGRYWPYDRIPEAVDHTEGGMVILYPGAKRWVEAAQAITERLPTHVTPDGRSGS